MKSESDADAVEPSCVLCAIKHIGTAHAYMQEFKTGSYPENFAKMLGELNLAAAHLVEDFPVIADRVRTFRLAREKVPSESGEWTHLILEVQKLKEELAPMERALLDEFNEWFKQQKGA